MFQVIGGVGGAVAGIGAAVGKAIASMGPGNATFRVEPDQVMQLADRFDNIADQIEAASRAGAAELVARPPGADKPSRDAADRLIETAFGGAGLVTRTRDYAAELRNAAKGLRDTAQQYAGTDQAESARFSATAD